jgi:hypothetical protein
MSMTKIHIISDLHLGFNEHSIEDEVLPDADIVIINGNIGHMKRSMLYAETLCKKYPDTPFIYNLGETELYHLIPKFVGEIEESLRIRKNLNATWPDNLYWPETPEIIKARNGYTFDVFCTYGFPKIHSYEGEWKDSRWARFYIQEILDDDSPSGSWYKPTDTSNVRHGHVPKFADKEWINAKHEEERLKVRAWELKQTCHKLLITHMNPMSDTRYEQQKVSPYLIHLEEGIWVAGNTRCDGVRFLGSRLYSNPGRGVRDRVLLV